MQLQHTLTPGGCLLKRVKTTNSAALQSLREMLWQYVLFHQLA